MPRAGTVVAVTVTASGALDNNGQVCGLISQPVSAGEHKAGLRDTVVGRPGSMHTLLKIM